MDQLSMWRHRAVGFRATAKGFKGPNTKEMMLAAATSLEDLAADREVWVNAWVTKLAALNARKLLTEIAPSAEPAP